jgi:hypothetical protein
VWWVWWVWWDGTGCDGAATSRCGSGRIAAVAGTGIRSSEAAFEQD